MSRRSFHGRRWKGLFRSAVFAAACAALPCAGFSQSALITVAGNGQFQFGGDGGSATNAGVTPDRVALDGNGNLYIADCYSNRIRRVSASTGIITTVAGNGTSGFMGDGGQATAAALSCPRGVAVDSSGNIFIA